MLKKEDLRKSFAKKYEKYYETKLFKDKGFIRKHCSECGKFFWTKDMEKVICGDPEHEPYSFIKENIEHIDYVDFWRKFAKFFIDNGHKEINKYPVVSRWRKDLYFTIASIQDFQRIENGKMSFEYAENPLIVPQICLRFNDIPNVGITGRHMTSFMMAGQHAFNYPKEGYWKDETIRLNYDFLTKELGVKSSKLTYLEDVWAMGDFSEFGPSLESFSGGLELVNSVFTEFEYTNGKINELKSKVVDVGWGFERLMWFKSGAPTIYDAVFPNVLNYIYSKSGIKPDSQLYNKVAAVSGSVDLTEYNVSEAAITEIIRKSGIDKKVYNEVIRPHQAAYAIADHTRTLLFAIGDGALPSNVRGGYNLRVILRRIFDFMDIYNIDIDLSKVIELHIKDLKALYPDINNNVGEIGNILNVEKRRYENMKRSTRKLVERIVEKGDRINFDTAKMLYESNGITPDFIHQISNEKGIKIDIDEDVYSKLIKKDFVEKKKKENKNNFNLKNIQNTEKLYYNFIEHSKSKIIKIFDNVVVLDKTPFYPEGGGQEADHGTIDGNLVIDVNEINGIILHTLKRESEIIEGKDVECVIDTERRKRLMAHHTATHLISASVRKILGNHAWQEGAKKSPNKAHIDIAHYETLSDKQIEDIENLANSYILNGIKVKMREMSRGEAEAEYGFSIYQGHGIPAARLRIVEIRDLKNNLIDAEACGGLHIMDKEFLIGIIKITNVTRIHDGVERIEFVAGNAALDYISSLEHKISAIAKVANIDVDKLESKVPQLLREMDTYKKRYMEVLEHLSDYAAEEIMRNVKTKEIISKTSYNRMMIRNIATKIADKNSTSIAMLYNDDGDIVCVAGTESGKSAVEFLKNNIDNVSKTVEFIGGGTKRIAEGKLKEKA